MLRVLQNSVLEDCGSWKGEADSWQFPIGVLQRAKPGDFLRLARRDVGLFGADSKLGEQFGDDAAAGLRELLEAAGVEVSELGGGLK